MDLKDLVIMGLIVYSSVYILCRIYINHSVKKEYFKLLEGGIFMDCCGNCIECPNKLLCDSNYDD